MRSSLATALAVLTLLSLLSLTSACPAPKDNRALAVDSSAPIFGLHDKEISLKVGQEFVLKLESNPTTGFTWMLKDNQVRKRTHSRRGPGRSRAERWLSHKQRRFEFGTC